MTDTKEKPILRDLDEIRNLDEPIFVQKEKAKRGRPRSQQYLSYAEAREFVRSELIPSRNKYDEWWERNKPKTIPHFPYRTYKDDWISWGDFLGNNNEFVLNSKKRWRRLEEAALWVHSLKIQNYNRWIEYCRVNPLPADIPARPDLVYNGWKSWNHWLGSKPVEALEAIKEQQKVQVYYIIHEAGVPENVFTFGIDPVGPASFKDRWEREQFQIIRMFWYDSAQAEAVSKILTSLSSPYMGEDRQRICQNMWEINYYLELTLQRIIRL